MALHDVLWGRQTWSSFISSQDQIQAFEHVIQGQSRAFERAIGNMGSSKMQVAVNQRDYQIALESGLGALGDSFSGGMGQLAWKIEIGFDQLSMGIDQLNADFNLLMGEVIWKLEVQNETLAQILRTLQTPLDTAAKELRYRAEDAYRNGWYNEALTDFLESERKNYQDFAVHRSVGNIYLYHLVSLPKALEYFLKAAKYARPRDARQSAEAEFFAGIVCGIQQDFQQGLEHLTEATRLNNRLYEAWYMHAGFAALVGSTPTAIRSLGIAIQGDPRYHERAKSDPLFNSIRAEVQSLLDAFLNQVRAYAIQGDQEIEGIRGQVMYLLPDGRQKLEQLIWEAHQEFARARTYFDYLRFTNVPLGIKSNLRNEESRLRLKETAERERDQKQRAELASQEAERRRNAEQEYEDVKDKAAGWFTKCLGLAVLAHVLGGFVACLVRIPEANRLQDHTENLIYPFRAYIAEAFYGSLSVLGIGVVGALFMLFFAAMRRAASR